MKMICFALALFSMTALAQGYDTGTFSCGDDPQHAVTFKISNDGIAGLPVVEYTAQQVDNNPTLVIRGLATVEDVVGGTMVGIRGIRGSDGKFAISFNLDGSITTGTIPCKKN
jgi:hypothetical protein